MSGSQRVQAVAKTEIANPSGPQLYLAQRGRCAYCNSVMCPRPWVEEIDNRRLRTNKATGWTKDHVFPRSIGARPWNNVLLSCVHCNQLKRDEMPTKEQVLKAVSIYKKLCRKFIVVSLYGA